MDLKLYVFGELTFIIYLLKIKLYINITQKESEQITNNKFRTNVRNKVTWLMSEGSQLHNFLIKFQIEYMFFFS